MLPLNLVLMLTDKCVFSSTEGFSLIAFRLLGVESSEIVVTDDPTGKEGLRLSMTGKKPCQWGMLVRQSHAVGRFKDRLRRLRDRDFMRFCEKFFCTSGASDSAHRHHSTEGSSTPTQFYDSQTLGDWQALYESCEPGLPRFQRNLDGAQDEDETPLLHRTDSDYSMLLDSASCSVPQHPHGLPLPTSNREDRDLYSSDSFNPLPSSKGSADECDDMISELCYDSKGLQLNSSAMAEGIRDVGGFSSTLALYAWAVENCVIDEEEEHDQSTGRRGWHIMKRIFSACKWMSRMRRFRRRARARTRYRSADHSERFMGVRRRNGKWVSEIRVFSSSRKVWLGSFDTEKAAALAFDAGKYHSSTRYDKFNFPDSPQLLGPKKDLHLLPPEKIKTELKKVAKDFAEGNY